MRAKPPEPFDPLAPVIAPGPDRPSAIRSTQIPGVELLADASPFRSPSAEHPDGTLLVVPWDGKGGVTLVEVDIRSLAVVEEHVLPEDGRQVRVAATDQGIIVAFDGSGKDDGDSIYVLDPTYRVRRVLQLGNQTAVNVHADGGLAAVAIGSTERAARIISVDLASGAEIAQKSFSGWFGFEWVMDPQIVVRGDRIYSLAHGRKHYTLRLLSRDLKLLGEHRQDGTRLYGDEKIGGPWHGDGQLAPAPDGVVLVRRGSARKFDQKLSGSLPQVHDFIHLPAVDPQTGRVLFATGAGAGSLGDERLEPVVVFRRDFQKLSDSSYPRYHNEPVLSFFSNKKGVILTKHPGVRLTVVEWDKPAVPRTSTTLRPPDL